MMQAGGWRFVNIVSRYVENANLNPLLEKAQGGHAQRRLKARYSATSL